MAYAVLTNSANGTGRQFPLQELRITETAMRGYEWEARLADDGTAWLQMKPSDGLWIVLYDDAGQSMTFPQLAALQISQDATGTVSLSGLDATTWKLCAELDPSSDADIFNSTKIQTIDSACSEICASCGVTYSGTNVTASMYGIGTVSGTAMNTLDRVLGLFNYEWRVDTSNRLCVYPLLWQSAGTTKSLPMLSARHTRDFEQRKTSMTFSKYLSLAAGSGGTRVTAENGTQKAYQYTFTTTDSVKYIGGSAETICYCIPFAFNAHYTKIKVVDWGISSGWKLELYQGYPDIYNNELAGGSSVVGSLYRDGDVATTGVHYFSHARICKTFSYRKTKDPTNPSYGVNFTGREFPTSGGMQATLQCYTDEDADMDDPETFSYEYDTGRTPENPDENVVSDTLWTSKSQCQSLAPGQMWANNRSSHCVDYVGPWVLGLHVRDCIRHSVYPTARVDQVTYSLSGGVAEVSVQCAVLGASQW